MFDCELQGVPEAPTVIGGFVDRIKRVCRMSLRGEFGALV
jgi:hypothetical protein